MGEALWPHLPQVAPACEAGPQEHPVSGPLMHRWMVPQDNTHTRCIACRHVRESEGGTPAWCADRRILRPGQLAADASEAGPRQPGDAEAEGGQRPIAIQALEHLGATERGSTMFCQHIRRGIRRVQEGWDPAGRGREAGAVIPPDAHETVVHVPPAATPEADQQL